MGASSSRATGGRGGRGSAGGQRIRSVGLPPPLSLQKHRQLDGARRAGALPQAYPRRVVPSDHSSGNQSSSVNSDKIQQLDQAQLSVLPRDESSAPPENMLASEEHGRNSIEEAVTSQVTQAVKALSIAGNAATEPVVGCASEAVEVHDKPEGNDSALQMIAKEEEDDSPIFLEEDDCPICLEGFDEENPKLIIQCEHFYHLSCILEWMERSATCPICGRVAIFDELF